MCVQRKRSILLEGMQSGERTTELHQAAAFAKSAQIDSGEAELLDQRGDTVVGFGVVAGEEYDLPTGGMPRVRHRTSSACAASAGVPADASGPRRSRTEAMKAGPRRFDRTTRYPAATA